MCTTSTTFSTEENEFLKSVEVLQAVTRDIATGKRQHKPFRFALELDGVTTVHASFDKLKEAVVAIKEIDYKTAFEDKLKKFGLSSQKLAEIINTNPSTPTSRIKITIRITLDNIPSRRNIIYSSCSFNLLTLNTQ
jgi:hypothetical protein